MNNFYWVDRPSHFNPRYPTNHTTRNRKCRVPREILIHGVSYGFATPKDSAIGPGWLDESGEWFPDFSSLVRRVCNKNGLEIPSKFSGMR